MRNDAEVVKDVPITMDNPANETNGAETRDPILNARDRLFHTLFFRLSLAYARYGR